MQCPSTMVTGEEFLGVLWRVGYFGADPKPGSGVIPLHTTLRISVVLTHRRKIPQPVLIKHCKGRKKILKSGNHQKKLHVPWGFDGEHCGGSHAEGMPAILGQCLCVRGRRRRRRVATPRFVCRESLLRVWQDGSNLIRRRLD